MKRKFLLISILIFFSAIGLMAQKVAVKTNALYWGAMGSPNAGVEVALGKRWTMDLNYGMNRWKFDESKRFSLRTIQPELRLWTCEPFNGHYFGLHAQGGQFNLGGWNIPIGRLKNIKDHRYEGYFYGAGISYGYQFMLSPRWNIEAGIGAGYNRVHYRKYPCATCGSLIEEDNYNYWGVTKATISLVYIID